LSGSILWQVGVWYRDHGLARLAAGAKARLAHEPLPRHRVIAGISVLVALMLSKFVYLASIGSYLTFYLIDRFGVSVSGAQLYLFVFLASVALGTLVGGHVGDRFGRKRTIWFSILGVLPFTLLLPHANLFWTGPLIVVIGLILASAFPAIVVFAQELVPGRVGLISGLFFGLAFGAGGIGAALLGVLADRFGIEAVYSVCAYLPAIGLLAALLPNVAHDK
jgi:FSR family fosmidomycin resistance protein-like MFS transporter